MKYLLMSTLLLSSILSSAQVNTGGPDFPSFQSFEVVTVNGRLPDLSGLGPHQVSPVVIHHLETDQFKVISSSDLNAIVQAFQPKTVYDVVYLVEDTDSFIFTELDALDRPLESYGYQLPQKNSPPVETPDWLLSELVNRVVIDYGGLENFSFRELFNHHIGHPILLLTMPSYIRSTWVVFSVAHGIFSRNSHEVLYLPISEKIRKEPHYWGYEAKQKNH